MTRLRRQDTHTHTRAHSHLELTDQSITAKSNKLAFSQDLTSDEKHMSPQVASLYSNPITSADRARSEQFFTRPDAQEREIDFPDSFLCTCAWSQPVKHEEAPCTFHDSSLKNPSANVSLAPVILPSSSRLSPQPYVQMHQKEEKDVHLWGGINAFSERARVQKSSAPAVLLVFVQDSCKLNVIPRGLIAPLQQTTLSPWKYTVPTPARQASHKGSKHVRLPAASRQHPSPTQSLRKVNPLEKAGREAWASCRRWGGCEGRWGTKWWGGRGTRDWKDGQTGKGTGWKKLKIGRDWGRVRALCWMSVLPPPLIANKCLGIVVESTLNDCGRAWHDWKIVLQRGAPRCTRTRQATIPKSALVTRPRLALAAWISRVLIFASLFLRLALQLARATSVWSYQQA